jgi:hypothetical protein
MPPGSVDSGSGEDVVERAGGRRETCPLLEAFDATAGGSLLAGIGGDPEPLLKDEQQHVRCCCPDGFVEERDTVLGLHDIAGDQVLGTTTKVATINEALRLQALRAEAAQIIAALDSADMDFSGSEDSFRHGGGRDLSALEQDARSPRVA